MITPRWTPREPPLPAVAAAAHGTAAAGLATAVLAGLEDGRCARLRAACDDNWLLVLSDDPVGADLPWADDVSWLCEDSPLLLPTHLTLRPAAGLVARAAARHVPDTHTLLVLLPDRLLSAPAPQRPVAKEQLLQFLEGKQC